MPETEQVLASNPDQGPGAPRLNWRTAAGQHRAEIFNLVVPPDATSARIASAEIHLSKDPGGSSTPWKAELRKVGADGKPSNAVADLIESVSVPVTGLPVGSQAQPYTVNFGNAVVASPADKVALCLLSPAGGVALYIGCQTGGTQNPPDMYMSVGGGYAPTITWAPADTVRDFLMEVKGTVTTP